MATGGGRKTKVYSRVQHENTSGLEGMSFRVNERSSSASASNDEERIDDAKLKELLGDLPERLSDVAGLGNMPELTLMVEDDEVIARFEEPETARLLREISMDPSKLEELKPAKEIQWMLKKLEEKKNIIMTEERYAQYRDKLQPEFQAQAQMQMQMPFQM